jgi:D-serine deaminase-like pyridoxal phosphate-dependent protein
MASRERGQSRVSGTRNEPAFGAVGDLDTPAVTIRLDIMENNIRRVQAHLARYGLGNRPHVKTHKVPAIGRLQMQAGAIGITCQKIGEVAVFVDAGVADDILLTFNVLGRAKTERLMALCRRAPGLTVTLDNEVVARGLSEAAARHGVDLPFLIDCDTGFARTGVQTPAAAFDLARAAARLPRLQFRGLMTFPNREPATREFFARALELFQGAGIPVPIVSGGGTPALFTAQSIPSLTEHRAGTCVFNDVMMVAAGVATWDDCAMRVRVTVVSRPTDSRAILDAGTKVLTSDQYGQKGYGRVLEYPDAVLGSLSEEHGIVDLSTCRERPEIGEVVHVVPNHCCVVSNMVDELHGVRGDRVEVVWPVAARGRVL